MKKFFIIFSIACIAAFCFSGYTKAEAASEYELTNLIAEQKLIKARVHEIAEIARSLGFEENHPIITNASKEWHAANTRQKQYNSQLVKWEQKKTQYPCATYIWNYLKQKGFNDYIVAGILGNIMAEAGGQTLNINPFMYSSGYYGMCMWSLYYCPEVSGMNLEQQCNYLVRTMVKEFNAFGFCYRNGFNYNSFKNLTNAQQAALAFSKCYERNSPVSYYIRQRNAQVAYNYFTTL